MKKKNIGKTAQVTKRKVQAAKKPVPEANSSETKDSNPAEVDAWIKKTDYPLMSLVKSLRKIILDADPSIGEEIKWNAPSYFYTGEMKPFNPKEYKRHFIVFNIFQKDCVRLVLWRGASVDDGKGLLQGDYADGRRLMLFKTSAEVKSKEKALQQLVKQWLGKLDK